ncbi:hypothetical protein HQ587_07015 [bacterium]|nr:hypothetical protein [bacterium]
MEINDQYAYMITHSVWSEQIEYFNAIIPTKNQQLDKGNTPFSEPIGDTAVISPQARALFSAIEQGEEGEKNRHSTDDSDNSDNSPNNPEISSGARTDDQQEKSINDEPLSESEEQKVRELQERDREVRSHEQAHKAAAGSLPTSGPNYSYQTGPDGRQYAVGGKVNISMSDSDDPEVDLRNAKQLERAALAPAEPSAQDRKVAANASRKQSKAMQEISEEQAEEMQENKVGEDNNGEKTVTGTSREDSTESSIGQDMIQSIEPENNHEEENFNLD